MACRHTNATVAYCKQCDLESYVEDLEFKYSKVLLKNKALRKEIKNLKPKEK